MDEIETLDAVIPLDHTQKMLGLIALLLGQFMGRDDITAELCCPWVDTGAVGRPDNAAAKQLVRSVLRQGGA